jgi:ribonuclease-3
MEQDESVIRQEATVAMFVRLGVPLPAAHIDEALTHSSLSNEHPGPLADNQRLEFLGDAVLSLCVSEMLMLHFDQVDEGELTVMRAALVNTVALAEAARENGLGMLLRMGRGAEVAGARERDSVLADAVEALLGAVFLDCGLDASRRVVATIAGSRFDALVEHGGTERDPKSRLQELVQSRGATVPDYRVLAEDGPPHAKEFTVGVNVALDAAGEQCVDAQGRGRSKKLAERAAALKVLELLSEAESRTGES